MSDLLLIVSTPFLAKVYERATEAGILAFEEARTQPRSDYSCGTAPDSHRLPLPWPPRASGLRGTTTRLFGCRAKLTTVEVVGQTRQVTRSFAS